MPAQSMSSSHFTVRVRLWPFTWKLFPILGYTTCMYDFRRSVWEVLFRNGENTADRLPWWLVPPVRFAYLVIQEFSRNRCFEKASALGFQTVFSLIPALALALFFFHIFGDFSNLGHEVERFIYHRLNIDKISLRSPEGGAATEDPDTAQSSPHESASDARSAAEPSGQP